jgi:hypothetical protein
MAHAHPIPSPAPIIGQTRTKAAAATKAPRRHKGAPPPERRPAARKAPRRRSRRPAGAEGAREPRIDSQARKAPDLNAIKGTGSRGRPRGAGRRRPHGIAALSALCSATRRSGSRNRGAGLPGAFNCALYLSVRPGILLRVPGVPLERKPLSEKVRRSLKTQQHAHSRPILGRGVCPGSTRRPLDSSVSRSGGGARN